MMPPRHPNQAWSSEEAFLLQWSVALSNGHIFNYLLVAVVTFGHHLKFRKPILINITGYDPRTTQEKYDMRRHPTRRHHV